MIAGGADFRGFLPNDDVTAVAALPHLDLALGKDLRCLHIVQQGTVALLMVLFNGGDQAEALRQLMKALLVGGFGKAVVHIRPLVVLTPVSYTHLDVYKRQFFFCAGYDHEDLHKQSGYDCCWQ